MPRGRRAALLPAALVAAGALYAWLVAGTTPFTATADVLTAIPLAALAVVVAVQLLEGAGAGGAGAPRPWDRRPDPGLHSDGPGVARQVLPWLTLVAAALALELFNYLSGARATHPTISSMYDSAARWRAVKALVVLAWLGLGWYLVRR
jgi:hypothetical protein